MATCTSRLCTRSQLFYPTEANIGFGSVGGVREGDGEVTVVVTSNGRNEEAVNVMYSFRSGTAQGTYKIHILVQFQ